MTEEQNNTPVKRNSQAKKPAQEPSADNAAELAEIQQALNLLKPLISFQEALEYARENDCELLWDVRLVSRKDTLLRHVHGTSSLPSCLVPKMIPYAPSNIESEVAGKITGPLVSFVMTEIEKTAPLAKGGECSLHQG